MKIAARILSVIALTSIATLYTACGPDDPKEKSDTDKQIELLNGTWTVSSATFENVAPDLNHNGMQIKITGSVGNTSISYEVTGRPTGPSAWPPSGTFTFGSDVKTELIRDDGVPITYNVTENQLTLGFTFDKTPYNARTSSVSGDWSFVLTK